MRSHSENLYIALRELAEFTAGDSANLNPIEVVDRYPNKYMGYCEAKFAG